MVINPSEITLEIVENMIAWREELNLDFYEVNGVKVIDCSSGGYEAGLLVSEICQGGLSLIEFGRYEFGNTTIPSVQAYTDFPYTSCMCIQKADFRVKDALISGPGKILTKSGRNIEKAIKSSDIGIFVVETSKDISNETIDKILLNCKKEPEDLFIVLAPSNSLVGSIQISSRVIETALNKMESIGYDLQNVEHAVGSAPIAPISSNPKDTMAKANDAIIYGGEVNLTVSEYLSEFERIPSHSSSEYGKTTMEVLSEVNYDIYKVDEDFFAPAVVTINDSSNGALYTHGLKDDKMLMESFKGEV